MPESYICSRCREYVRGPLDSEHVCPDRRSLPAVGQIVYVSNRESTFLGQIGQVAEVHERTVFVRLVGFDNVDVPFGASEVATMAPGEVQEVYGK